MQTEEWLAIRGFKGYEVSNQGRVRSYLQKRGLPNRRGSRTVVGTTARLLNHNVQKDGRHFVTLYRGGRAFQKRVHVLVLEAFVGKRPYGMVGCHGLLGNQHNGVDNVYWATLVRNNGEDRVRDGTARLGEDLKWTKLTAVKVKSLRARLAAGVHHRTLAIEFGVTRRTVNHIANGKTWRWLK